LGAKLIQEISLTIPADKIRFAAEDLKLRSRVANLEGIDSDLTEDLGSFLREIPFVGFGGWFAALAGCCGRANNIVEPLNTLNKAYTLRP
jgi:hypothetical protein